MTRSLRDVVLVHGAWHGAWAWRRVLPLLWAGGTRPITVSLTGLGERAHALGPSIRLQTHVDDVVTAVRAEECRGAVLVGHSYAGLVVSAAADRRPERLAAQDAERFKRRWDGVKGARFGMDAAKGDTFW